MINNHINILSEAANQFHKLHSHRDQKLFTHFLPTGHNIMTLTCVPEENKDTVILIKSLWGMLITLYDDLADNPKLANEKLLCELYKIPFDKNSLITSHLNARERLFLEFAIFLSEEIINRSASFPHYEELKRIFEFDFKQFYNSNQYYALALNNINILNLLEIRFFGPFNMGMVLAGTIDIIASPNFNMQELGHARTIFVLGQRFAHICNSLTTLDRELAEKTYTNEALIIIKERENYTQFRALSMLRNEQESIFKEIHKQALKIKSFDIYHYAQSLKELQALHEQLYGII